ncbi:MAG: DUF4271 domain-containing protein [Bacteroidales bacterium]|nr:DUF4271 domain-containing protein [Bacteroidales bacterium]
MTGKENLIYKLSDLGTNSQAISQESYSILQDSISTPNHDSISKVEIAGFFNTSYTPDLPEKPSPVQITIWIPLLLVFIMSLVALIRFVYAKKLRIVLRAPFSSRFRQQLKRDSDNMSAAMSTYLMLISYIVWSILIYLIYTRYSQNYLPEVPAYLHFIIILLILFSISRLKYGVIKFWGHLFKTKDYAFKYRFHITLFSIFEGIIISPLLILTIYGPNSLSEYFILASVMIFLTLYLMRVVRGLLATLGQGRFFIIYFFLYLCTLEILPLLLLFKLITTEGGLGIKSIL